jgi:hypothetical protein
MGLAGGENEELGSQELGSRAVGGGAGIAASFSLIAGPLVPQRINSAARAMMRSAALVDAREFGHAQCLCQTRVSCDQGLPLIVVETTTWRQM